MLLSFLQVLHSEQLLGSLQAEMLTGEVRGEGRLSVLLAQEDTIFQTAVANICLI